jgi:hypothetical protein
MKPEVAAALAELERKLRELEAELAAVSRAEGLAPAPARAPVVPPSPPASPPPPSPPPAPSDLPAHGSARLIDEAGYPSAGAAQAEEYGMPPQGAYAPARGDYQPPSPEYPVATEPSLVELVRFRQRLEHTLGQLMDEYARLLEGGPTTGPFAER